MKKYTMAIVGALLMGTASIVVSIYAGLVSGDELYEKLIEPLDVYSIVYINGEPSEEDAWKVKKRGEFAALASEHGDKQMFQILSYIAIGFGLTALIVSFVSWGNQLVSAIISAPILYFVFFTQVNGGEFAIQYMFAIALGLGGILFRPVWLQLSERFREGNV